MNQLLYVTGPQADAACREALLGVRTLGIFPLHRYANGVLVDCGDTAFCPDRGTLPPAFLDWLHEAEPECVLLTGPCAADMSFLDAVTHAGYALAICYIGDGVALSDAATRLQRHPVVARLRKPSVTDPCDEVAA